MASNSYRFNLYVSQVNNRKYPKLKEVDDVLGGAAAWENVDSTAGKFQVSTSPKLIFWLQLDLVRFLKTFRGGGLRHLLLSNFG